jgi:hypothetical protein
MTKQMMSFEGAALMLADTANGMSEEEFEVFACKVLEDNSPEEIAILLRTCRLSCRHCFRNGH